MATVRIQVEMEFGQIVQFFPYAEYKYAMKIKGHAKPSVVYYLSTLFKNFRTCIHGATTSTNSMFKVEPPSLKEYIKGLMRNRDELDIN